MNRFLGLLALGVLTLVSCQKESASPIPGTTPSEPALTRAVTSGDGSIVLDATTGTTHLRVRQVCYTGTSTQSSPHAQLRVASQIGVYADANDNNALKNWFLASFDAVNNIQTYPGHGNAKYMHQAFSPSEQTAKEGTSVRIVLPSAQTPHADSVDPKADLLLSNQQFSVSQRSDPSKIYGFTFQRLTAAGKVTVRGLDGVTVQRVEIKAAQEALAGTIHVDKDNNQTVTDKSTQLNLNVSQLTKDIFGTLTVRFGCLPFTQNQRVTVTVKTNKGNYAFPFDNIKFQAGNEKLFDCDIVLPGSVTTKIASGVEYTRFHGQWKGQWREFNIIKTALGTRHLGIFFDYSTQGLLYLNEKCEHVGAIAGTNGPMACCQFVRVNGVVKHAATQTDPWIANCALTIDGNAVDIVQVQSNQAAAGLTNASNGNVNPPYNTLTVGCAGPLLVWNGVVQTYPAYQDQDFIKTTHPRTAIGIGANGQKVIQVTVDGRWTSSNTAQRAIGLSTDDLAELMLQLGCDKAMNLDGGGGSQMWVTGRGDVNHLVNHPHNEWPYYGCGSNTYYWIKDNQVARRTTGNAVYVY